mgnify:CR=1 FL=1|jgi:hypothetical protein
MIYLFPYLLTGDAPDDPYFDLPVIAYRNRLAEGVLTASSAGEDGAAANAITGTTFDFWRPLTPASSLEVELPGAQPCDYCAIAAHTLGSRGYSVTCQYWQDGEWVEAGSVLPANDEPVVMLFPEAISDRWRIVLNGVGALPVIGVAMIGPTLTMQRGIIAPFTPPGMASQVSLESSVSLGGHLLGQSVTFEGARFSVSFAPLDEWWVRGDFAAFRRHFNVGGGFVLAWSPASNPQEVGYCWRAEGEGTELTPVYREDVYMDVTMEVRAHVG